MSNSELHHIINVCKMYRNEYITIYNIYYNESTILKNENRMNITPKSIEACMTLDKQNVSFYKMSTK